MKNMSVKELLVATNGKLEAGNNEDVISRIIIDSREAKLQDAFIALIGESLDGHKFMESAYQNGCRTFIKNESSNLNLSYDDVNIILVEDTTNAMADIAHYYKNKFEIPFIGVTGSVGKTTTRDMVFAALSSKLNTLRNVGNFNNQIGVPLTLFNLDDNHECAVIEMGMTHFGDITHLVNVVVPKIGVISNIGLSHIENLGSQEGIFKSKMEITSNFDKECLLIVNGDDKFLSTLKEENLNYGLKTFGFDENNDIYCTEYTMDEESINFECIINNKKENIFIPTVGKHNIYNAMAAILVGLKLNMSLDEIREGLKGYKATKMRLDIIKNDNNTIINDTYNASPDSMKAALDILGRYKQRKVAILGDMFEMGSHSEYGHRLVGAHTLNNADVLITIGNDSKYINDEASLVGFDKENLYHFATKEDAIGHLDGIIKDMDVILVKASRGMALEKVVEHLNK